MWGLLLLIPSSMCIYYVLMYKKLASDIKKCIKSGDVGDSRIRRMLWFRPNISLVLCFSSRVNERLVSKRIRQLQRCKRNAKYQAEAKFLIRLIEAKTKTPFKVSKEMKNLIPRKKKYKNVATKVLQTKKEERKPVLDKKPDEKKVNECVIDINLIDKSDDNDWVVTQDILCSTHGA